MRGEVGKETPKKEMDNRRICMTSHMTLSAVSFLHNLAAVYWNTTLKDCPQNKAIGRRQ